MVVAVNRRNTQRGTMASVLLDDKTGRIEAALFSETYERYRDEIANDRVLVVEGTLAHDEYRGGLSIRADRVSGLEDVRLARATGVEIRLCESWWRGRDMRPIEVLNQIRGLLEPASGGDCEVRLRYRREDAEVVLRLGEEWRIKPTDGLLRQVRRLLGAEALNVRFRSQARETSAGAADYAHSAR